MIQKEIREHFQKIMRVMGNDSKEYGLYDHAVLELELSKLQAQCNHPNGKIISSSFGPLFDCSDCGDLIPVSQPKQPGIN